VQADPDTRVNLKKKKIKKIICEKGSLH
jgi:hypothetical protein